MPVFIRKPAQTVLFQLMTIDSRCIAVAGEPVELMDDNALAAAPGRLGNHFLEFFAVVGRSGFRLVYVKFPDGMPFTGGPRNLSREVRKGQKEAALKAQHVTGPVPYGYRVDEHHRYVVVPEEAAVIREIFRRLDGGESIADVTRWAVTHGIKTHKGTLFNELAITRLTQQPILVGRFSYGVNSKDGQPPIIIENAVEPILEPSVFWRQYEKTTARKKGPRSRLKEEEYLLTGYLYCEYCGSHLYGFKSKSTFPLTIVDSTEDKLLQREFFNVFQITMRRDVFHREDYS